MPRKRGWRKRPLHEILARNERGQKQCRSCWEWLDERDYGKQAKTSDGLANRCRACDRFKRYLMTRVDVVQMLVEQGNRCPICSRTFASFRDFVVDHDNGCCAGVGGKWTCGKCTRGLICQHCNVHVLGTLENPALVQRAYEYLDKYGSR